MTSGLTGWRNTMKTPHKNLLDMQDLNPSFWDHKRHLQSSNCVWCKLLSLPSNWFYFERWIIISLISC